jgi:hypothetical protein
MNSFTSTIYEGVTKRFRTGCLERELKMVQLSTTRCSCIAILWVSLVSFAAITLYVASQRVFIVLIVYFVIDSVRKLLDTPSYYILPSVNTSYRHSYDVILKSWMTKAYEFTLFSNIFSIKLNSVININHYLLPSNGKGKVPVFFNWAPGHGGVLREWRYSSTHSLTSVLDGGEWSASHLGRFTPRERAPGTHWIGDWVGLRAGLDAVVKRKILSPCWNSNPRSSRP